MESIPATSTSPKGLLIRIVDAEHQYGQVIRISDDIIDVVEDTGVATNYTLSILPNSIGKSKLKNPVMLVPEVKYFQFHAFDDSNGKYKVLRPSNALMEFLTEKGFGSATTNLPDSIVSNILTYSGVLQQFSSNSDVSHYTKVAELDVDPRYDVEFQVWGTSNSSTPGTTYTSYAYGLSAITRQYWADDDTDRDLFTQYSVSPVSYDSTGASTGFTPVYNTRFGVVPHKYTITSESLSQYPTKKVTLYLASGTSSSLYQGNTPASFNVNIQARVTLATVNSTLLVSGN